MFFTKQDWLILETFQMMTRGNSDTARNGEDAMGKMKASLDLDFLVTLGGNGSQHYFAITAMRLKMFETLPKIMIMTFFEEARGQVSIARTKGKI